MNIANIFDIPLREGALFGCELEIEGVYTVNNGIYGCATVTDDGSLREGGVEIISEPLTLKGTFAFFSDAYIHIKWREDNIPHHSERTSVHVHVNASDLEAKEVRALIRNYYLLEPGFFEYINESRKNNIYCVPLSATTVMDRFRQRSLAEVVHHWHKYTAFNVKPLITLGTMEFRHLQGTEDLEIFTGWLERIARWREYRVPFYNFDSVRAAYAAIFRELPSEETTKQLLENYLTLLTIENDLGADVLLRRMKEHTVCAG